MYPVHDVDATLLLALSLASKRRPAELVEIVAACDLTQGAIPPAAKLSDAFYRLSEYGLIAMQGSGYLLTPDAQQILSGHAKKARRQERIYDIKENLADYHLDGIHPVILLTTEHIAAAIAEHLAAQESTVKNLLSPKPVEDGPGQKKPYQPFFARRRKD